MKAKQKIEKPRVEEPTSEVEAPAQPEPVKAAKAATEPWNAENAPDSALRRGFLGLARGKKGFQVRWVRHDAVDRRKAQGYVLAKPEDFDASPDENGMIRRNELVLMIVPKETFDARREEVSKQTKLQAKSAKREFLEEREKAGRKLGHSLAIRGEEREDD